MDGGYRLLEIRQEGDAIVALLPHSKIFGNVLSQALLEDCQRLVQRASGSVLLDLRQVEIIDGSFFTRVLQLWRGLKDRSIRLTVQLSPVLAEVARTTKLDQILEITDAENATAP